jgi:YtkA-like
MHAYFVKAVFLTGILSMPVAAGFAAANDYAFEPVQAELKKGDDVVVALRLMHKPTGKAVPDAVIIRTRIDMAPDGMAEMASQVTVVPSSEPGTYAFKTDLPMAGRYLFSIAAKVQGERETVLGKVILKAVK